MSSQKSKIGKDGETIACEYVKKLGYEILHKNWRYSNVGEIDIVAKDKNDIVFIEVKTRSSTKCGSPLEAVNTRKQKQIFSLAEIFISEQPICNETTYRFDVIGIFMTNKPEIIHIKEAFSL